MTWSEFSTKVLQITILDINDCDKPSVNIQKKIHLRNRIYIYIIKCMISIKIPQKGRKKNFKFPLELQKEKLPEA